MAYTLQVSLTSDEISVIRDRLGREPNELELAIIDAEWSEHCSYKSSKSILKQLPTVGSRVLLGPGFDAGVLDLGDGYVATLHIESHNHPSAIDPYGGAATGVGGILRDILCMNTRPIALLNSLRFGRIDRSSHSRWLFKNVVRGISDYGNCVGVPDIGGEVEFDESFERNCLVDVVCIGLGRKKSLLLAEARYSGDWVVIVGGLTGRDGIHGATFASRDLSEDSDVDRPSVQIPDPFTEKLIIEATLEAAEAGWIHGLKDLGGGGLSCGLSELAEKGGSGIEVDISRVPVREEDLSPVEIMISESQERMLFVIDPKGEEVFQIFEKYGLPSAIIGVVNDSQKLVVTRDGLKLADLPVDLVVKAPLIHRNYVRPAYLDDLKNIEPPSSKDDLSEVILSMLSSPNIASRRWIYEQYDHEVGVKTVVKPGQADSAVLRLSNGKFLAVTVDGNSKHCYLDPYNGAAGCLAEACRNLVSLGAEPLAMVDHLQFGNPGSPEIFWTFVEAVRGMADYCKALDIPCVGGKVSFYNEDMQNGRAIKPSPVVAMIGLIEDSEYICKMSFREDWNRIVALGVTREELGGSEYFEYIFGLVGGAAPKIDFELEKNTLAFVRAAIQRGFFGSIHDCSKGGLGITLAEMCIAGDLGAEVDVKAISSECRRVDYTLFSESHSRFIAATKGEMLNELKALSEKFGVTCREIGSVGGDTLILRSSSDRIFSLEVERMKLCWEQALPRIMGE